MEQINQNIDIPQENNLNIPSPTTNTTETKKTNPKIFAVIGLIIFGVLSLLITTFSKKVQVNKSSNSHTPTNQTIDITPTLSPDDPLVIQLKQIKTNLNNLEDIPDLNIEEKLTF